ncbi:alpha/beta fold hydrolase [Allorhizobium sp. BGMRC 0089]|uniref:alpha/beta fold hydrolase n=1 Tax=Allorhizobium sonneratiae TaxID=2934936 RepID=UPI002033A919|nr:alpha/beta fold hydrolase [Allorhizobium sonneratiae]MCM2293802.1 alpha/beta fold hydrolase [Allorhizobium sonneratiae]
MFLTINNCNLHVCVHGDETRPALILLHSLGACADLWQEQVKALSRDYFVVCPDFRGHGLSELSQVPLTIDILAQDVIDIASALELPAFHLAGVSIGGMVAQSVAGTHPERVKTLTVFDSSIVSLNPRMWQERAAKIRADGLASIAEGVYARWITPGQHNTSGGRGLATMLARASSEGYAAGCDALAIADCRPKAARITMPAIVAVGEFDEATPPAAAKVLADAIGTELTIIEGAAHIPMLEQAQAVTHILMRMMARAQ